MEGRNAIWWFCYVAVAIWLQKLFPGVDFFTPGVLLSLQEERFRQTAILVLLAVFIQEGGGSMPFGFGIAWYACVILMFYLGCALFVADNRLFVLLLSLMLGCAHFAMSWGMVSLISISPPMDRMLREAAEQAVCIPVLWMLGRFMRNNLVLRYED